MRAAFFNSIKDIIADHFSGNPQAGCLVTYPISRFYGHLKVSKALLPCHGIFRNFWESMGGERNAG